MVLALKRQWKLLKVIETFEDLRQNQTKSLSLNALLSLIFGIVALLHLIVQGYQNGVNRFI